MSKASNYSVSLIPKAVLLALTFVLSGCELVPDGFLTTTTEPVEDVGPEASICLTKPQETPPDHNCDLVYWVNYWTEHGGKPWQERKTHIQQLGNGVADRFRKILLSQGKGTPYQDRLRAQSWAEQLSPQLTDTMASFLNIVVFQTSQELLEFESALAILTRVNADQARQLDEQSQQLKTQQQQIDKLLKIEASMMEKREGINQ